MLLSIVMVYRIRDPEFMELWELTLHSITGIMETADVDFELIVIDNGSHSPEYSQMLNQSHVLWNEMYLHIKGFRNLRFDDQVSLSKAWNAGIHQADGDYIVIANNDIVYHEREWMSRLVAPFEDISRKIGIVGIQHMSWAYFSFVEGSLFAFPEKFKEEFDLRDDDDETVYPLIFDEQFTFICDVDFNYRVQQEDYEVIQVNDPPLQPMYLQHLGHRTINTLAHSDEDFVGITHKDRITLCEKWGFDSQIVD